MGKYEKICVLTRFCFSVPYALSRKKNNDKEVKKNLKVLPAYLSYFFGACNPQCRTQTYFHAVESVLVTNM